MHIKKLDISGVGWLAAGWQTDDYIVGRFLCFIFYMYVRSTCCHM